ncbi:MAG: hypothetical protein ACC742_05840 [Thermoanaerobaculales bacterium]
MSGLLTHRGRLAFIPGQLFCYRLTRAKGHDTEKPRGLTKVTLTW